MKYTPDEVMQYVLEEDVKFVRMAFCDICGKQRNVAIMAAELPRAFSSRPSEAAVMPLPSPDTTPPVTKIYLLITRSSL